MLPNLVKYDTTIHTAKIHQHDKYSHKSIQFIFQGVFIVFSAYTKVIQIKINLLECSDGSPNARNQDQNVADKTLVCLSEDLLA